MDNQRFFNQYFKSGNEILAGLISVDIVGHSKFKGSEREKADTKAAFATMIGSQFIDEIGTQLPWQGDGGFLLFDIKSGCDDMILFADRIRQLVPLFNRTLGLYNRLPYHQEIIVNIVAHAGMIVNEDDDPGHLSGEALNILAKRSRDISRPGYVIITSEVHKRLSTDIQDRCLLTREESDFGKVYALDGSSALTSIQYIDRNARGLKEWIDQSVKIYKYDQVLYFAYTNELLYEYLGYQIGGLDVKILARNWLVEKTDEEKYNRELLTKSTPESSKVLRPWFKSDVIKLRAKDIAENARVIGKQVDIRFYDSPPLFNGAILIGKNESPRAYIGISKWEEFPEEGGSPYKLEEWPAIVLDGRDNVQMHMIDYIQSRFWQMWKTGQSYDEICNKEAHQLASDPGVIGTIWKLDGQPYLMVYPHRIVPARSYPVVALEDVMAFRLFEKFLTSFGIQVKLLRFEVSDDFDGTTFPKAAQEEIDNWQGHVIYICTKSLSTSLMKDLHELGFPYEISGLGSRSPALHHRTKELVISSPTDKKPPVPRDYAIIARFPRPENKGMGYISAGIRAMGTWGAADYFTNFSNVHSLSRLVKEEKFVAIIETTFDPIAYRLIDSRLHMAPEKFLV